MNVAIIEYNNIHFTYINSLIHIFNVEENFITIFTTKEIKELMKCYIKDDKIRVKWVIIKRDYKNKYLNKIKLMTYIMQLGYGIHKYKFDKIIFPSPEYWSAYLCPFFLFLKSHCDVILSVHNLNKVFLKPKNIKDRCFQYMISKCDSLAVLENNLRDHILNGKLSMKTIYVFPFDFYRYKNPMADENKISFVVPGNIHKKRKNYQLIMNVFESVLNMHNVELVILGSGTGDYAEQVLQWAQKMREQKKQVVTYNKFVPVEEYENRLRNATIIVNPIKLQIEGETYGVTKSSGTIFEMIAFAKPAILPKEYNVPVAIKSSVIQYENEDSLINILDQIIKSKEIRAVLKKEAVNNSSWFEIDKIRDDVRKCISDVKIKNINKLCK